MNPFPLDLESWLWPLPAMALLLGWVALPIFRKADAPPTDRPNRFQALDGLRGFLAFAVFFHHANLYHEFSALGTWDEVPHSRFYFSLGPLGVAFFFMITGFLFWSKLIDEQGKPDWLRLYIGRFFRIYPLFFATTIILLTIVFAATRFHLQTSIASLAVKIAEWLALGAGQPDVNGYAQTKLLIAGVAWSLHWEAAFYLSLPLMAWAAARKNLHLPFSAALFFGLLLYAAFFRHNPYDYRPIYIALLAAGMLTASLHHKGLGLPLSNSQTGTKTGKPQTSSLWASALLLILIPALFLFRDAHLPASVLLQTAIFYLITSGANLFGLLKMRAAVRLGNISYGIYLLQGFAFATLFRIPALRQFSLQSPLDHWLLTLLAGMVLILYSLLAHILVERPGIALGKRVAATFRKKTPTPQPIMK